MAIDFEKLDFSSLEKKNKNQDRENTYGKRPVDRGVRDIEEPLHRSPLSVRIKPDNLDFSGLRAKYDMGRERPTMSQMDEPKEDKSLMDKWQTSPFVKGVADRFKFTQTPVIQDEEITEGYGSVQSDKSGWNYMQQNFPNEFEDWRKEMEEKYKDRPNLPEGISRKQYEDALNRVQYGKSIFFDYDKPTEKDKEIVAKVQNYHGIPEEEVVSKANELRQRAGQELPETTSFNIGQALGSMAKFAGLYSIAGGAVESSASPALQRLGTSAASKIAPATPSGALGSNLTTEALHTLSNFAVGGGTTMATELVKDIVIGQPIHYIEAKDRGLEGEELRDYLGGELMFDVAANTLMWGAGKGIRKLKDFTSTELEKIARGDFDKLKASIQDIIDTMAKETNMNKEQARESLQVIVRDRILPFKEADLDKILPKVLDDANARREVSEAMVDLDIKRVTQNKNYLEETWNEITDLMKSKYGTVDISAKQAENIKNEIGIDPNKIAKRLEATNKHIEDLMQFKNDPEKLMDKDELISRMRYGIMDENVDEAVKKHYDLQMRESYKPVDFQEGDTLEFRNQSQPGQLEFDETARRPSREGVETQRVRGAESPQTETGEQLSFDEVRRQGLEDLEQPKPDTPQEVGYESPRPKSSSAKEVIDDIEETRRPFVEELDRAHAKSDVTKKSKFTKTAKDYAGLDEELTQRIKSVDYKKMTNADMRAIGGELADKYPRQIESRIRDTRSAFTNDLEAATALEYVLKMQDVDARYAGELVEEISKKFTVSGKIVQIASMWSRITKKGLDGFISSLEKRFDFTLSEELHKDVITEWSNIESITDNNTLKEMIESHYLKATRKLFSGKTLQELAIGGRETDELVASLPDRMKAFVTGKEIKDIDTWLDRFLKSKSTKKLQELNRQVLLGRIRNEIPKTGGKKLSTIQAFSHLLNFKTFSRNIISNTTFNIMEDMSNTVAWGADYVAHALGKTPFRSVYLPTLSPVKTGKRFAEGLIDSADRIKLGVNAGTAGKYTLGNYGSAFSADTLAGRAGRSLERLLSYELQATDEAYKNVVRGNVLDQLKKLSPDGNVTDEMMNIANQEALYRTFQDDSYPAFLLDSIGDFLNTAPIAPKFIGKTGRTVRGRDVYNFGLKDLTIKYTRVPGNIISRSVEYTPFGSLKLFSIASKIGKKGMTLELQRDMMMTIGRAATGTSMIAMGKWLADKGVLVTQDPGSTPSKAALESAQGIGNTKLNMSALDRFIGGFADIDQENLAIGERITGKSNVSKLLDARDGDELITINSLAEPFSKPLAIGGALSKVWDGKGNYLEDAVQIGNATWEEIVDLPTMSVIKSMTYQEGAIQAGVVPLVQALPGMIPSVIRHAANYQVPEQREAYTGGLIEQGKRQIMQNIPGLREKVPERLSPIGETIGGSGNRLKDLANAAFSPGKIEEYRPLPYNDILENIAEELDTTDHYPSRSAPKTIAIGGVDEELTPEQKNFFQKTYGELVDSLYTEVSDQIRDASAREQHAVLSRLKRQARTYAREATIEKYFMNNSLPGLQSY